MDIFKMAAPVNRFFCHREFAVFCKNQACDTYMYIIWITFTANAIYVKPSHCVSILQPSRGVKTELPKCKQRSNDINKHDKEQPRNSTNIKWKPLVSLKMLNQVSKQVIYQEIKRYELTYLVLQIFQWQWRLTDQTRYGERYYIILRKILNQSGGEGTVPPGPKGPQKMS